jgi:heterodisulfide reductase subunit A-like polyferredoxin
MKKIFLLSSFLSFIVCISAQTQGVAYTAVGKGVATTFLTDYQCLGINTSALGWGTGYEKKKMTMGSSEFGFGIYSDVLTSEKLKNFSNSVQTSLNSGKFAKDSKMKIFS